MDMVWNDSTKKLYESGVDRAALFIKNPATGIYDVGVPWNGFISVTETPEGAEPTDLWANNAKYATLMSAETFGGSIEAYTYPTEFGQCDGSEEPVTGVFVKQQDRKVFGMAYRTRVGSDAGGDEVSYKYHLVYGCRATPSEAAYSTINDSPEALTFSWDFTTTPAEAGGTLKPTSLVIIDTAAVDPADLLWLENQLYGDSPNNDPNLPTPQEVIAQFTA